MSSLLLSSRETNSSNTTLDGMEANIHLSEEPTRRIENWLHSTNGDGGSSQYTEIWDLLRRFLSQQQSRPRPATICAIVCVLIEHALRQDWCDANGRPTDTQAQHGALYVTLDGHGQRNLHDLILHTRNQFLSSANNGDEAYGGGAVSNNKFTLDGPTRALLTDLFYSPTGPNTRSSLPSQTWHAPLPDDFRPVFSYLEDTRRHFRDAHRSVQSLVNFHNCSFEYASFSTHLNEATTTIPMIAGEKKILIQLKSIVNSNADEEFLSAATGDGGNTKLPHFDVYSEFHLNQRLESLAAARPLLKELSVVALS